MDIARVGSGHRPGRTPGDNPHTALALTSKFTGSVGDAGENLYSTHVLVSHDDGSNWTRQGVDIEPSVLVETIEVARSDPNRIYVGGATRQATPTEESTASPSS